MSVKNITLSAEQQLISLARQKAAHEKKSLNVVFREWLAQYVGSKKNASEYRHVMKKLSYAKSNKHFSREELNER